MLERMLLAAGGEEKLYVEDVFSTWLYTGTGSSQTITNGIDLSGKGGLVWVKSRSASTNHFLFDTARGVNKEVNSNNSDSSATLTNSLTAFNSNGFALGSAAGVNTSADTYASWTFREAPKFFDVVTYTGNSGVQNIPHNLGVAPGVVIVKSATNSSFWCVQHRSLAPNQVLYLNTTGAVDTASSIWNNTAATATTFTVGPNADTNAGGQTYVAYLFAHDPTADGIIQCGSFDVNGSGLATVNLGWEPQWVMVKNVEADSPWAMFDNMRGMPAPSSTSLVYDVNRLSANTSNAESTGNGDFVARPLATGFEFRAEGYAASNVNGFIYIAIRRGPMKTPTVGTSVFAPITGSLASGSSQSVGFAADSTLAKWRTGTDNSQWYDRLRGYRTANTSAANYFLSTDSASGESTLNQTPAIYNVWNDTALTGGYFAGSSTVYYHFRRAPGFFDVVCYTGTGSTQNINHSLKAQPEVVITKSRSAAADWQIFVRGAANTWYNGALNSAIALQGPYAFDSLFTSSTFFNSGGYASGTTYVAYLFASCPGVSKVGSYTGNGSSQTINCGFSNGARFFLVKRTDSTGDWWVYDSARGIVAAADPALRLNSTAAEVTSADAVDTNSTGIIVNQEATCNINVNGATYIYLAIA